MPSKCHRQFHQPCHRRATDHPPHHQHRPLHRPLATSGRLNGHNRRCESAEGEFEGYCKEVALHRPVVCQSIAAFSMRALGELRPVVPSAGTLRTLTSARMPTMPSRFEHPAKLGLVHKTLVHPPLWVAASIISSAVPKHHGQGPHFNTYSHPIEQCSCRYRIGLMTSAVLSLMYMWIQKGKTCSCSRSTIQFVTNQQVG